MRRQLAAIALILAVLVPVRASAECAWVLWQKWGSSWIVQAATPSYDDCLRTVRFETDSHLRAGALMDSSGNVRSWHCLPDTIDPRGPKKESGR